MGLGLLAIRAGMAFSQLAISEFNGNAGTRVQIATKDGSTKNKLVSAANRQDGYAVYSPNSGKERIIPGEEFTAKISSKTPENTIANVYAGPGDKVQLEGRNIEGAVHSSAAKDGRATVVVADLKNSVLSLFGNTILTNHKGGTIHSPRGLGDSKLASFDAKGNVSFSALAGFEAHGAIATAGPKFS